MPTSATGAFIHVKQSGSVVVSGSSSALQTVLAVHSALIGQLLDQGGGASVMEHIFPQRRKSGREIMAEALTGTMRADAGMYRQAARNAMEGKSITDILHTTAQGLDQAFSTMITALSDPDFTSDANVQKIYDDARQNLLDLTGHAEYNGTKLLDGSVPEITLYIGRTNRQISLDDLKTAYSRLPLAGAVPSADVPAELTALNTMRTTLKLMDSAWQAEGAGFKTTAETLKRQAKIYDLTAARSILGARADPSDRLLNALLSDQGRLMNFLT
jgi:hypothetical protein